MLVRFGAEYVALGSVAGQEKAPGKKDACTETAPLTCLQIAWT